MTQPLSRILDALKLSQSKLHPVRIDLIRASWTETQPDAPRRVENNVEFRAHIELQFCQIAPRDAEAEVRRHAVRSISAYIYGPIFNELAKLSDELYRRGPENWDMVFRIGKLISDLEGKP